jgi:hypothetical protein
MTNTKIIELIASETTPEVIERIANKYRNISIKKYYQDKSLLNLIYSYLSIVSVLNYNVSCSDVHTMRQLETLIIINMSCYPAWVANKIEDFIHDELDIIQHEYERFVAEVC